MVKDKTKTTTKKYKNRNNIWENPDIFLLDFLTMDEKDLYSKYNIGNKKLCSSIRLNAIKKAEDAGIDITFYYEEVSKRKGYKVK